MTAVLARTSAFHQKFVPESLLLNSHTLLGKKCKWHGVTGPGQRPVQIPTNVKRTDHDYTSHTMSPVSCNPWNAASTSFPKSLPVPTLS